MIRFENVCLQQGTFRLHDLSFHIPPSAYAVCMGASGCGKTSMIEALCGLRRITSGKIFINGQDVTRLRPAERHVAYVPQDRALFPQHSVREQLAFGLVLRKHTQQDIHQRVTALAKRLDIAHLLQRMPETLSGGETQRVSLGRALATDPKILCLDEPLSALDEDQREDLCHILHSLHQETAVTILHITHSTTEAKRLATCSIRMHQGAIAD